MKKSNLKLCVIAVLISGAFTLTGCGGTKLLKESQPLEIVNPLSIASDRRLTASLDWVIVRDGPGTWAENADWDEYLIRVQNLSGGEIQITGLTVLDSLGTRIEPSENRKQLVIASKDTVRRYKAKELRVKAGFGVGVLVGTGAAAGVTAAAIVAAGPIALSNASAVAVATGGLLLAPVLTVYGVVRAVNNSNVNRQILLRQTRLPLVLHEEEQNLDIFFPLTPSPRQVELTYVDSGGERVLTIDTSAVLAGLHLSNVEE